MSTKIEWVRNAAGDQGLTVNPIRFRNLATGKVGHHCEKISAGCKNCYASTMNGGPYLSGLTYIAENRDKGEFFFDENVIQSVLRRKKPTAYFWVDMSDMFGSWVPDEWIDFCFATMALTARHRHFVLTKRAERMREYLISRSRSIRHWEASARSMGYSLKFNGLDGKEYGLVPFPLPNVWLGVSVEDRAHRDRIDILRETPAALRFLSLEPLLEDLGVLDLRGIGWVIGGSESGPGMRIADLNWFRYIRNQCVEAGIPFFLKQAHIDGKLVKMPMLDGRTWDQMPEVRP